jgi:hypothetical protein
VENHLKVNADMFSGRLLVMNLLGARQIGGAQPRCRERGMRR